VSGNILLITLGPVQEFIAQARRTRDLWYGSHLLSELSRAGARYLAESGARLIFPALASDDELVPCLAPLRSDGRAPDNVANRLLAEVPADLDPRELARGARDAVQRFWREEMAEPVRTRCAGLIVNGIEAAWDEQIGTFLEFAAAWAPLPGRSYPEARRAVESALAARKNLRDFQSWRHLRGGVPKSSLDGERETVLRPARDRDRVLARKYRIDGAGEQLDAVGLVKRAGGAPEQFVPIVNVALACWIALAAEHAQTALEGLRRACVERGVPHVRRNLPVARAFGFDASLLLRGRWKPVFKEHEWDGDPDAWGRRHVEPLFAQLGEPYPYVACLVADGDRMGRIIDRLPSADAHRALSRSLAGFAREARAIVEQEHLGSLVYAGGDDVLAFLPLPTALACAGSLRNAFARAIDVGDLPVNHRPTLSVGIGVGHVMEGMGDLLALGREAERFAKDGKEGRAGRNALAVVVDKRSGKTRRWRASWDHGPAERLGDDVRALDGRLTLRKVYEIDRTLRQLPPQGTAPDTGWMRVLGQEVRRSLSRVLAGEAAVQPAEIGLDLDRPDTYAHLLHEVTAWVERMQVARTFAMAVPGLPRSIGGSV
jgi:CRISPR-associated protein Cmr2